jgi:hypothetical protein
VSFLWICEEAGCVRFIERSIPSSEPFEKGAMEQAVTAVALWNEGGNARKHDGQFVFRIKTSSLRQLVATQRLARSHQNLQDHLGLRILFGAAGKQPRKKQLVQAAQTGRQSLQLCEADLTRLDRIQRARREEEVALTSGEQGVHEVCPRLVHGPPLERRRRKTPFHMTA